MQRYEEVAQGTFAFHFERPAGFDFQAGQSVNLVLLEPPAAPNSARRTFSLVSAPFEPELAVATRLREGSAFKQALKKLPIGAAVKVIGPLGRMTLHEDTGRAAVFIAGGIGITPFVSMLRQSLHERSRRPLLLLYANHEPESAAFLAEVETLAREHESFRLCARMTATEGRLDESAITRFVSAAPAPIYYVAGPPGFVETILRMLATLNVENDAIRSEMFYGY